MTSACHRARNLSVFSCVQKGTPGLTLKGCVLQRESLGALSDVTVVLGMRQSIVSARMARIHPMSIRSICDIKLAILAGN